MQADALAPRIYKRSMIMGGLHRIFRASTSREKFREGVDNFRDILMKNGYCASEIEDRVTEFMDKLGKPKERIEVDPEVEDPVMVRLQYRGQQTDRLIRKLRNLRGRI